MKFKDSKRHSGQVRRKGTGRKGTGRQCTEKRHGVKRHGEKRHVGKALRSFISSAISMVPFAAIPKNPNPLLALKYLLS